MPAKDIFHDIVKSALVKDGWTITHDPLTLELGKRDLYVDFGAERLMAAERAGQQIAVEVKSFVGPSEMHSLEEALGQFLLYRSVMARTEPDRTLYLAVEQTVFTSLFESDIGFVVRDDYDLKMVSFDVEKEVLVQWID